MPAFSVRKNCFEHLWPFLVFLLAIAQGAWPTPADCRPGSVCEFVFEAFYLRAETVVMSSQDSIHGGRGSSNLDFGVIKDGASVTAGGSGIVSDRLLAQPRREADSA